LLFLHEVNAKLKSKIIINLEQFICQKFMYKLS
jgi:hypothetical protein